MICKILVIILSVIFYINISYADLISYKGNAINLGKQQAKVINVEIPLFNSQDVGIKITKVHTSCSCTDYILQDSILKSNSETELLINYDLSNSSGNKNTLITIEYLSYDKFDTTKNKLYLNIFADVQCPIELSPNSFILLQNQPKNKWFNTEINITNKSDNSISLQLLAEYNKKYCDMEFEGNSNITIPAQKTITVKINMRINYLYYREKFILSVINKSFNIGKYCIVRVKR